MFSSSLDKPAPDNYRFLSAWLDDWMAGFACFGWEALTCGTWDLFWVCTLPSARGKGIGKALVTEVIRVASSEKGRLIVVNTSSTPAYLSARKLYEANQFVRTATVPEYYNVGDDLFIYTRNLRPRTHLNNRKPSICNFAMVRISASDFFRI
jgi:ribosomal protein S18 acetylase RimI-like enzyme